MQAFPSLLRFYSLNSAQRWFKKQSPEGRKVCMTSEGLVIMAWLIMRPFCTVAIDSWALCQNFYTFDFCCPPSQGSPHPTVQRILRKHRSQSRHSQRKKERKYRVSFENSFNSKQPKLELKLVLALSETKYLFRLFHFYTEKDSFDWTETNRRPTETVW